MRYFTIALLLLLAALARVVRAATPTTSRGRPNIIFILTDDQRWDSLSIMGHPFLKTPNIDRIGREGAVFKNYFVTLSLCSPSRATILTGEYADRNGVTDNRDHSALSHKLITFPMHLHDAGYETAMIGKWHMGTDATPRPGFDRWVVFPGQGRYPNPVFNIDGKPNVIVKGYITDILTKFATEFIEKDHAGKPWCMYIGHKAVHAPFMPPEQYKNSYNDKLLPLPPDIWDDMKGKSALLQATDKPLPKNHLGLAVPDIDIRNQLRCIQAVDDSVGEIFKALEKTHQLDNTVIVFTSDNGYFWNEHHLGDKREVYEEGARDPFLVRYPPLIKPGTTREQMVLNIDIAPTFLDLAGVPIPSQMQGKSLVPLFTQDIPTNDFRSSIFLEYYREPLYPNMPTIKAVRTDRWKYITYPEFPGMEELYDLKTDPYEMKNLVKEESAKPKIQELKTELAKLRKQYE